MDTFGEKLAETLRALQTFHASVVKDSRILEVTDLTRFEVYKRILMTRNAITQIVGNLSHRNTHCHNAARKYGIIECLLSQTSIDDYSEFLKERSIFALRNLTLGSEANQRYIREMKLQKVVQSDEMREMGISAEYDPRSSKVKVRRKDRDER